MPRQLMYGELEMGEKTAAQAKTSLQRLLQRVTIKVQYLSG